MNEIFHDMSDVCVVYINDLMIFTKSDNQEEHDKIVLEVLRRLEANNLFVKPEKSHNAPTLSHTIWTAEGEIRPCLMGWLTHSPDSVGYHLTRHSWDINDSCDMC